MPEDRLNRIEDTLTRISEKLEPLPRIDERLNNTADGMARLGKRIDDQETRLQRLEKTAIQNSMVTGGVRHFGWLVVAGVVGVVTYFFKGGAH